MKRNRSSRGTGKPNNKVNNRNAEIERADLAPTSFIRAIKKPVPVMVGLASVMVATNAMAQSAGEGGTAGSALPAIDVQESAGGGTGSGYNPGSVQLSRMPTTILNTPQSITVIPQQLIEDQHTSTLVEALHNVPGITFFGGEGGTQGDQVAIHGYNARNDFYRDGIRDPGWYTRDTFSVESIEVLKGPSSFLFGRGSTGGVINMTSKLPKFMTDFATVEVAGYSSPGIRSTVDINRSFGDVATRIVALGLDSDVAGRDHVKNSRVGVAPSLTYKFNNDTRATVSYIYQHDDNVPDYGIPIIPGSYFGPGQPGQPLPVPKNTFYGTVNDYEKVDAHIVSTKFEHDFNNDWKFSNDTRYSNIDRSVSVRGTQPSGGLYGNAALTGPAVTLTPSTNLSSIFVKNGNYFENNTQNTLATNLTGLTGRFNTGFIEHTIATGVEVNRETRDHLRTTYAQGSPFYDYVAVNLISPNPYTIPGVFPATNSLTSSVGNGVGVYFSDQIKLNKYFELLAGVRYDYLRVSQDVTTLSTATGLATLPTANLVNTVNFTSWRGGAVFHPVENSSIYFMYGTSFDPSSEYLTITNGQQNLPPTTNETYEVGVKYDMFNRRLSLSGAVFRVTQNNAIEAVDSANGIYSQVGKTRVDGFEVGIAGKITDQWSVFGGYTYMDGTVLSSAIARSTGTFVSAPGNALQNVPYNTFSLTTSYAVTPDFTVGGGAYYVGDRWVSSANTSMVPDYWRFDTMANYKFNKQLSLQLNVWNILDTKNFESFSGFGSAQPGPGRTFILTAKYTFNPDSIMASTDSKKSVTR